MRERGGGRGDVCTLAGTKEDTAVTQVSTVDWDIFASKIFRL